MLGVFFISHKHLLSTATVGVCFFWNNSAFLKVGSGKKNSGQYVHNFQKQPFQILYQFWKNCPGDKVSLFDYPKPGWFFEVSKGPPTSSSTSPKQTFPSTAQTMVQSLPQPSRHRYSCSIQTLLVARRFLRSSGYQTPSSDTKMEMLQWWWILEPWRSIVFYIQTYIRCTHAYVYNIGSCQKHKKEQCIMIGENLGPFSKSSCSYRVWVWPRHIFDVNQRNSFSPQLTGLIWTCWHKPWYNLCATKFKAISYRLAIRCVSK